MYINRSGYYKWKYRKSHPSKRHLQRIKDVEFIKEEIEQFEKALK